MGVSQNEGYLFGGPLNKAIVFRCLYWGSRVLGNYHVSYSLNSLEGDYTGDLIGDYYRGY